MFVDPPTVAVSVCTGYSEGQACTLTCETSGGNPATHSFEWRFKRRFTDTFSLVADESDATLYLPSLSRSEAGVYRCSAVNSGGVNAVDVTVYVYCTKFLYLDPQPSKIFFFVSAL